jgi:hypothetical protein
MNIINFVETYQIDGLPHESVSLAFLRLSFQCPLSFLDLSALSVVSFSLFPLYWITMNSDSPLSPADATRIRVTDGKRRRKRKGCWFLNQKSCEGCWWKLKGNFSSHTIQHKAQNSTGKKSHGTMAGVKQQEFGDPCGGHVVD